MSISPQRNGDLLGIASHRIYFTRIFKETRYYAAEISPAKLGMAS